MIVGVLALQGGYDAHRRLLETLGAAVTLVRKPEQLDSVDALVIPGGESTTFLKFLEHDGFWEKLRGFVQTRPAFGTCAGTILLATTVENPQQAALGALDITVQRNAYGRQRQSLITPVDTRLGGDALESVFIRAPRIVRVGPAVEVLAEYQGDPVWVRQGRLMATTFHPELSTDLRVHTEFLRFV